MNFWNIATPTLTLLAPAVAGFYFLLASRASPEAVTKWNRAIFGILTLVAAVAIVQFESPVRLEFLWPFAAEPSGYFEFTLHLHWSRYVWIFFSSAVLLAVAVFDGQGAAAGPGFRFTLLAGASLFSSLAYLSENVFLSIIFIEMAVFLLYAYGVLAGKVEENQERMAYFKRGVFVFLALLAILGLSLTRRFDLSSILLMGVALYFISFIFSRHSFPDWRYLAFCLLQTGAAFFLLGRVVTEEMSQELFLPLSAIFGVTVAIFSWFSLVSVSALGSAFWMLFSFVCYLLFLRFSSGRHGDQFWGTYEAIALLAVLAIGLLLRFGRKSWKGGERAAAILASLLLVAIVAGALPGVDVAGARVSTESSVKLLALGALTFLISMVVGKALARSFSQENKGAEASSSFAGLLPSLALFLVQIGATAKMTDLYGESPFRMGVAYLLTNSHIVVAIASIGVGLLAGYLLGRNSHFMGWAKSKEIAMEELFPRLDPAIVSWNQKAVSAPRGLSDWVTERAAGVTAKASAALQSSDRFLFGERFYRGLRRYGSSVSAVTHFFHSGSLRAYFFLGVAITLIASALFLWEGR